MLLVIAPLHWSQFILTRDVIAAAAGVGESPGLVQAGRDPDVIPRAIVRVGVDNKQFHLVRNRLYAPHHLRSATVTLNGLYSLHGTDECTKCVIKDEKCNS